jgi:hypothetical protein
VGLTIDLGFCREQSIAGGEPIAGSAIASTPIFVALEHPGAWGARAIEDSDLSDAIKARLGAWEEHPVGVRVQLVRREAPSGARTLLVACCELGRARTVAITLHDVDDLLAVDLDAIVTALRGGAEVPGAVEVDRPQLLVCTNGRRDRCCAKWGLAVYRALDATSIETWQTTHLGGHRFAATLLWLPHGICFGRLTPDEAAGLVAAIERGEIDPIDRLRGRICASAAEQAAEAEWRRRSGSRGVDDIVAIEHDAIAPDAWRVRLRDAAGTWHAIDVVHERTSELVSPSCGKPPAPVMRWRFG